MEINYKQFIATAFNETFYSSKPIQRISEMLQEFVKEEQVVEIYPKGLYKEDGKIELLVIKKETILVIRNTEYGSSIESRKIRNISGVEFQQSNADESAAVLKISFCNEEPIVFNSKEDTNDVHSRKFARKIKDIFIVFS